MTQTKLKEKGTVGYDSLARSSIQQRPHHDPTTLQNLPKCPSFPRFSGPHPSNPSAPLPTPGNQFPPPNNQLPTLLLYNPSPPHRFQPLPPLLNPTVTGPIGRRMYPGEEPSAISPPTATRTADDSPLSPHASSGCSSCCFPCLDGARERGIQFSMKIREKSELIAGPKWKTFIRRFNRTPSGHQNRRQWEGRFGYDPLSYSLNFEEQNAGEEDEEDATAAGGFRNFSSRFASVAASGSVKPAGEVAASC